MTTSQTKEISECALKAEPKLTSRALFPPPAELFVAVDVGGACVTAGEGAEDMEAVLRSASRRSKSATSSAFFWASRALGLESLSSGFDSIMVWSLQ